jgi:hypothetical protein
LFSQAGLIDVLVSVAPIPWHSGVLPILPLLPASFHLAAFWLFHHLRPEHEFSSSFRLVSEVVRFFESFLPRSVHWWTDWYATNPEWFLAGIAAIALFMGLGSSLSGRIHDGMRVI